jgi:hypothetical protein
VFRSPRERANYPCLTAVCKREPLTCRAYDEYLPPLASEEDIPEGHEPPRLDEVKCALLSLDELEPDDPLVFA